MYIVDAFVVLFGCEHRLICTRSLSTGNSLANSRNVTAVTIRGRTGGMADCSEGRMRSRCAVVALQASQEFHVTIRSLAYPLHPPPFLPSSISLPVCSPFLCSHPLLSLHCIRRHSALLLAPRSFCPRAPSWQKYPPPRLQRSALLHSCCPRSLS